MQLVTSAEEPLLPNHLKMGAPAATTTVFVPAGKNARVQGACRIPSGAGGHEEWRLGEQACLARCALLTSCISVEHVNLGGYPRCTLHKEAATHIVPIPGFKCLLKVVKQHVSAP